MKEKARAKARGKVRGGSEPLVEVGDIEEQRVESNMDIREEGPTTASKPGDEEVWEDVSEGPDKLIEPASK